MTAPHRIFGMENSPYSVKVRSYFRYKGIPHEWIVRDQSQMAEFGKYAKLPLVPLVVTPDDEGIQDSTPILEKMEAAHPEPSIQPDDPTAAFASALLEEFGDEWGNKWMFHFRWAREADQKACSKRLIGEMMPGLPAEQAEQMAEGTRARMVDRVWFVGSSEQTAPQIEQSFADAMALLDSHLAVRSYVFGGRPAFGDFGLWGQIYNCTFDPTPAAILEKFPNVVAWIARMVEPKVEGDFESWESLAPTLEPLLAQQVAALFLPWSDANARAIADGAETFEVELDGKAWSQKPQKYHARSLAAIRKKYAEAANAAIDQLLDKTGCRRWLRAD